MRQRQNVKSLSAVAIRRRSCRRPRIPQRVEQDLILVAVDGKRGLRAASTALWRCGVLDGACFTMARVDWPATHARAAFAAPNAARSAAHRTLVGRLLRPSL